MNEFIMAFRFNKKRFTETVLAVVGIIIGLSSFVGAVTLLESFKKEMAVIKEQPSALVLRVTPRRFEMSLNTVVEPIEETMVLPRFQFSIDDMNNAVQEIPYITDAFQFPRRMFNTGESVLQEFPESGMVPPPIAPEMNMLTNQSSQTDITIEKPLVSRISGYEVTETFFKVYELKTVNGYLFDNNDIASQNRVAVVGQDLAPNLFKDGNALGKSIKLNGITYTIIGIVHDPFAVKGLHDDLNTSIFIPETSSKNPAAQNFRTINFKIDASEHVNKTEQLLIAYLEKQYGQNTITISGDYRRIAKEVEKKQSVLLLAIILSGLCIIASLINIINIVNNRLLRRLKTYAMIRTVGASFNEILFVIIIEISYIIFAGTIGSMIMSPLVFSALQEIIHASNTIQLSYSLNWLLMIGITGVLGIVILFLVSLTALKLKNISIVTILRTE